MRIAVINWTRLHAGGAETYLGDVIPELLAQRQTVGFWHESDEPGDWARIPLPENVPTWCAEDLGLERALAELRDWRPDLIYTHLINDLHTETRLLTLAPAVFFAHGHAGMCISGMKTMKSPTPTPCTRRFGWQCLLCYYPRRCGGLNPKTMWRDYLRQRGRLALLQKYQAIVVASDYLRQEYLKHGLAPERVHQVPLPVHGEGGSFLPTHPVTTLQPAWRLLYAGRMDRLKGGGVLLEALPSILAALGRPLQVTFAGDGPERAGWEQEGARLCARHPGLTVEFLGWQSQDQVSELYRRHDLIVVPSLQPETFGLVGPEAGLYGVPAAAFAVGGITTWLSDGINGHVASSQPPTAAGLAQAVARCLADPLHYDALRRGAVDVAGRFRLDTHVKGLLRVFEAVRQPSLPQAHHALPPVASR